MRKKIQSALISVYYKDKLEVLLEVLKKNQVKLYSTGGTKKFIEEHGMAVTEVSALTGFPEILGGRVKTLQPQIFGGILARRDNEHDLYEMQQHHIPEIDLVVVDLYPFEETVSSGANENEVIEKIDIGGISLIRAAAKNFRFTTIISSREDYETLAKILEEKNGETDLGDRKHFAAKAFNTSSHYDTNIFKYFNQTESIPAFKQSILSSQILRYGENPQQQGVFYGKLDDMFEKLNGKELSYNNLVDVDAALNLIAEFSEPAVAIIKHTNSCGLASRGNICDAYKAAFACDPTSAFGGIICANKKVDLVAAQEMNSLFFEVLIAPEFDDDALAILKEKKNRILLGLKPEIGHRTSRIVFKNLLNGVIAQDADLSTESKAKFKTVTEIAPTQKEIRDLEFAVKAVKHLKSNGIALVKNEQLIGMGCGQTSRVDALQHAIKKANEFGFDLQGAVMASDAFFPFPDCVMIAHESGITAIAQPGGSIKDQASVDAANLNKMAMVMTGTRHFKH